MTSELVFRCISGEDIKMDVAETEKAKDVIDKLAEQLGLPARIIKLVHNSEYLNPDDMLQVKNEVDPVFYIRIERKARVQPQQEFFDKSKHIPTRSGVKIPNKSPPDYEARVSALVEMGFGRRESENALKNTYFSVSKASEFLSLGKVPFQPHTRFPGDKMPRRTQSSTMHKPMPPIYDTFTQEQKQFISDIAERLNEDIIFVIQVAVACNFNEEHCMCVLSQ